MHDIEQRIRDAYGPVEIERDARDRGWDTLQLGTMPATTRRVRRMRSPRLLVAVAVLVVSVSSIAIAQPGAVGRLIGLADDRPADRMQVFEQDPVGTTGLSHANTLLDGNRVTMPDGSTIDPAALRAALTWRTDGLTFRVRSAPTSDGKACVYFENVGRQSVIGCSDSMRHNGHVTVGSFGDLRTGTIVLGLADDSVRNVTVRLSGGRTVPAKMGRNAYLAYLPEFNAPTRGVLVELHDGRKLELAMNGCLRSQVVPPPTSRLGCGYGMNQGPDPADLR